ncbi:MAG: hypothetical protein IKU72_05860 [Oscillospiraceae bacterium]|nr:hypothetical protein [Oscillospiraceae bacterium]
MSVFDLSPDEITALSVVIGFAFSKGLDPYEQNSLGYFFSTIGQVLQTIATQSFLAENRPLTETQELENQLAQLEKRLTQLQEKLKDA